LWLPQLKEKDKSVHSAYMSWISFFLSKTGPR
jgi:hypothetical protein